MSVQIEAKETFNFQIAEKPIRSNRISQLFNYTTNFQAGICIERARFLTEVCRNEKALPPILVRAQSVANVLKHMTLYILPGSMLVGNQASQPNYSPLFPEYTIDFLERELVRGDPYFPDLRPADRFKFDRNLLPELKEIFDFWRGRTHKDRVYAELPEDCKVVQDQIGAVNIVNFLHGGCGHLTPPWPHLFQQGLIKIISDCDQYLTELDMTEADSLSKQRFYKAAIISCEAIINYANRYSKLAANLAENEKDPVRKAELDEISRICFKVPAYPAETFHEALQFMTFIQFAIQIEDNGQGISPGRFDQVMNPYYIRDCEQGILDHEKALELIENFFILLSTVERVRSWEDTAYFRGKPIFQNLTTGGIDPETGSDSTNAISYLVLDAIVNTRVLQPSHYVRWHKGSPQDFKMRVAEVIRLGTGFPAIANDDLYIPAMLNRGYEYKDAADYCIEGCAEPGVAGLRGGRTGAAWFCLAKILEMALFNGRDPISGAVINPNSSGKDLASFSSYEEVWTAFLEQIQYYVRAAVIMDNMTDKLWEEYLEEPLTSIMGCTQTVMQRGRTIKRGGAKYDFTGNETIGTANVANSLYAIKQLIFERQLITGDQLKHALLTDFTDQTTNPTGPEIQQMCLSIPKYGNDIDAVDFIARDVLEYTCEEFPKYKNTRWNRGPIGGFFQVSTTTVSSNTPFGFLTGSLPDGRRKGSPLSDGQSPMRGTDSKGPTASVRSVAKTRNILLSEGSLYNLKLLPQDLRD